MSERTQQRCVLAAVKKKNQPASCSLSLSASLPPSYSKLNAMPAPATLPDPSVQVDPLPIVHHNMVSGEHSTHLAGRLGEVAGGAALEDGQRRPDVREADPRIAHPLRSKEPCEVGLPVLTLVPEAAGRADLAAGAVNFFLTRFMKMPLFVNGFAQVRSRGRRYRVQFCPKGGW